MVADLKSPFAQMTTAPRTSHADARAAGAPAMSLLTVYRRVLGLLAVERPLFLLVCAGNFALAGLIFYESWLFGQVVGKLVSAPHQSWRYIVQWAGFGLLGVALNVWVSLYADRLSHRRRQAAILDFFEHALALPLGFHAQHHSGGLLRIMHTGASNLFTLWLAFLRSHLATLLSIVVMLPIAMVLNWKLASLMTGLLACFLVSMSIAMRRTAGAQREVEKVHHALAQRAGDVLANAAIVQSFTRQEAEAEAVRGLSHRALTAQYPVLRSWAWLTVANRSASTLTVVAIFALGVWLWSRGQASIGDIVTFAGFSLAIIGRLDQLASFAAGLFYHAPALRDFFEVLDESAPRDEQPDAPQLPPVRGDVVFEDVSFSYPSGGPAVRHLSFRVPAGAKVALVGPTGAGKSTAASLLYRAHDPTGGRITIDGIDIRSVRLSSLRRNVAVVFQDAGLLYRTIADNIAFGRAAASVEQIERAARAAEAHEFIRAKPEGYGTLVSERGRSLSGGERQRLAIARAMLKDAPILVLDEATSALDGATELRIQRALETLTRGRTTFVIAHRLATIRDADLILVLEAGAIVEQGRYEELLLRDGAFARLARAGEFVRMAAASDPPTRRGSPACALGGRQTVRG
ncbi:MAG TPA: glucan ABC transporter ATP-binding protein/ permease [Steroidobacteraceae bacterium]|nr:glucan ABC transporter ATP-binding protein/ permease [Steroidobacteraceae bacterium]